MYTLFDDLTKNDNLKLQLNTFIYIRIEVLRNIFTKIIKYSKYV